MIVHTLNFTEFLCANIYFYINEKTKHGFLIDPGAGTTEILNILKKNNWIIEKILLTHSHLDHLGAALEISEKCHVPFFGLNHARSYLKGYPDHFTDQTALSQMQFFENGEHISLQDSSITLEVLETPGHTLDSVCFYDKENALLFSGDTLFSGGVGRTDLSGGNKSDLQKSLKKIFELPEKTVVYAGHGLPTTIKTEKKRSFLF